MPEPNRGGMPATLQKQRKFYIPKGYIRSNTAFDIVRMNRTGPILALNFF